MQYAFLYEVTKKGMTIHVSNPLLGSVFIVYVYIIGLMATVCLWALTGNHRAITHRVEKGVTVMPRCRPEAEAATLAVPPSPTTTDRSTASSAYHHLIVHVCVGVDMKGKGWNLATVKRLRSQFEKLHHKTVWLCKECVCAGVQWYYSMCDVVLHNVLKSQKGWDWLFFAWTPNQVELDHFTWPKRPFFLHFHTFLTRQSHPTFILHATWDLNKMKTFCYFAKALFKAHRTTALETQLPYLQFNSAFCSSAQHQETKKT